MSIAERLNAAPVKRPALCKAGSVIAELPDPDRDAFDAALKGDNYSAVTLAKILKLEGYPVGATTLKLHRAGECACVGR